MKLLAGTGVDVGITARDPAKLVRFYGEFLGLELRRERETPAVASHVWFFACGDSNVKVYSRATTPAAANPPGGHTAATGLRYLAFHVESLDDALDGLEAAGGTLVVPPTIHDDVRVAFIDDPEGNSIELVERYPPEPAGSQ
jgi:catechol 2,3-dioxygenase-like lactoylglutathione lyase family enzyme